jgi:hypothetical protein
VIGAAESFGGNKDFAVEKMMIPVTADGDATASAKSEL